MVESKEICFYHVKLFEVFRKVYETAPSQEVLAHDERFEGYQRTHYTKNNGWERYHYQGDEDICDASWEKDLYSKWVTISGQTIKAQVTKRSSCRCGESPIWFSTLRLRDDNNRELIKLDKSSILGRICLDPSDPSNNLLTAALKAIGIEID